MKYLPTALAAAACLCGQLVSAVQAQPSVIEARRYVNDQGVEVLISRSPATTPETAEPAPAPAAARTPKPMATAVPSTSFNLQRPASVAVRDEHRVSVAQQAARDEEVERLLTIEVLNEVSKLESKRKALRTQGASPDSAQRDELASDVQRHEENIRTLQRELARVRQSSRAAARSGAGEPSAVSWKP